MKLKSIVFDYDSNSEIEVRIDNVPKSIIKSVAIKENQQPDFEGVTEFLKVKIHGITIKLCRITTSLDRIYLERKNGQ